MKFYQALLQGTLVVVYSCHSAAAFQQAQWSRVPAFWSRNALRRQGSCSRVPSPVQPSSSALTMKVSSSLSGSMAVINEKIDNVLNDLTTLFPFFVVAAAVLGATNPSQLLWVNQGNLISIMLAGVMCGTGLTLQKSDFDKILDKENWKVVPLGVLCQYIIMPLTAGLVGRLILLRFVASDAASALFLGLCLVGCAPGGTASNLVSLIAHADVALSVILTACSTLLAAFATPVLTKLLVGSNVRVSGVTLFQATLKVVLAPVVIGMVFNSKLPRVSKFLSRFTPFASVLLVSLICGGVVAQNASLLSASAFLPMAVLSVVLLHGIGFAAGYGVAKLAGQNEQSARTISIEVGMQNSALAVVLAKSIGAPALAALPGALSATTHSCLGSILAAYWRMRPVPISAPISPEEVQEPEYFL